MRGAYDLTCVADGGFPDLRVVAHQCLLGRVQATRVDVAYRAVSELAPLAGAGGFVADCATAKAVRDLNALLYADGIHDSLYRAAGRTLTAAAPEAVRVLPSRTASLAGS